MSAAQLRPIADKMGLPPPALPTGTSDAAIAAALVTTLMGHADFVEAMSRPSAAEVAAAAAATAGT